MSKLKTTKDIAAKKASQAVIAAKLAAPKTSEPSCNLRPLGNKLIVKRDLAATQTPSGILLPEQAKETPKRGTVLAIGPEVKSAKPPHSDPLLRTSNFTEIPLAVGDSVYFNAYAGADLKVGDQTLLILTEDDVLAVEALKN